MKKRLFFFAVTISCCFIACSRYRYEDSPAPNSDSTFFSWWYIVILILAIVAYSIIKKEKVKTLFNKLSSSCKFLWANDKQQEYSIFNWGKRISELNEKNNDLNNEIIDLRKQVKKLKKDMTDLKDSVEQLQSEKEAHEKEKREWLEENIKLGEQIDNYKARLVNEKKNTIDETPSVSTNQVMQQTNSPIRTLYADSIIDDYFVKIRETPNDDSTFVLHLIGEDVANFNVYKPAYQRIMANPSFLEGCERQILGNTMQLEIVSEGKAHRDISTNKWKVVNKLNVIIK